MIITVISDSHIPNTQSFLPDEVINSFRSSDMILGLGDFIDEDTIGFLNSFSAPFYGVLGNCDRYELRSWLPQKRKFEIEGRTVLMLHGWGSRIDLDQRIYKILEKKPDICLFGHTHTMQDKFIGQTRFINPGACQKGGSFAVLTIDNQTDDIICEIKEIAL